jgi:acyl carrier protein
MREAKALADAEQLKAVMAYLFGCSPGEIPDDADPQTLAGWDSLRQVELMIAIETEFGVRVPTEAMLELSSLEKIDDFLREHAAGYGRPV